MKNNSSALSTAPVLFAPKTNNARDKFALQAALAINPYIAMQRAKHKNSHITAVSAGK